MATVPEYRPSNRTGQHPLGELILVAGGAYWFVDDIDGKANPIAYGTPDSEYRILPDRNGFILSKVGRFVKWPARRGEGKGRTRYFKTAAAAAEYAMFGENSPLLTGRI